MREKLHYELGRTLEQIVWGSWDISNLEIS